VPWLALVTLVWAFSFGLIKGNLAGVDPLFISFARLAIALLVFLPFMRWRRLRRKLFWQLLLTGALQFGLMYITYNYAFHYLQSYEVALLTITTPLYVTLLDDLLQRRFNGLFLVTALTSVIGTGVVVFQDLTSVGMWIGFALLQVSNLCFAFGQVFYRKVMAQTPDIKDHEVFGVLYLGGVICTALVSGLFTPWRSFALGFTQVWTLLYLGAIASGVSFFLWNLGARQVNAGALAIFNDLKVPAAITVSLLVFGEQADLLRLAVGGLIVLAALVVNELLVKRWKSRETIPPEVS
jgi:carboxylate/amino acid/amine transporter